MTAGSPAQFAGIFAAFVGVACVTDHDALARRGPPGAGGTGRGGSGGTSAGRDAGPDSSAGDAAAAGDAGTEASADAPTEPPGASRLTVFHGAVDAPQIGFCAVRVPESGAPQPIEPMQARGLAYATPSVLGTIPGVDFVSDGLRLIAVAADAPVLAATRCAEVAGLIDGDRGDAGKSDAGAPVLRARGLPLLPAGTLASGRSLLLVVTGCFGAPDHDGAARELVCGSGYTPESPTLGMALVPMSRRTASGRLGLQFVHASRATEEIALVASPPPSVVGPSHFVASEAVFGQIAPRFANVEHARADYGSPLETALLEVRRRVPETISLPWREALARGGVNAPGDGENLTIIFVGPQPGASEPWANPTTLTVIASDPK